MASLDELRRAALALPGAEEVGYRGEAWFNVGRKTFALTSGERAILKLERGHQELLFEIRPETFRPVPVATVRWSSVAVADLDAEELRALLIEAWSQIVPKKVSRPFLAGLTVAT